MKISPLLAGLGLSLTLAMPGLAQIGQRVPEKVQVENVAKSPAASLSDFHGRVVLVELFAFW